jgi:hypothetical protein
LHGASSCFAACVSLTAAMSAVHPFRLPCH